MKKIVPFLLLIYVFSCSKEPDCDCGIVEGSRTDFPDGTIESQVYYLDIRNECSSRNVQEDVQVTQRVYNEYGISLGERICNISGKRLN